MRGNKAQSRVVGQDSWMMEGRETDEETLSFEIDSFNFRGDIDV